MKFLTLPFEVQWTICGIFGLLILSTLIVFLIHRFKPQFNIHELQLRIRSWWVMVILFAVAMALSHVVSIVFFALISFLALKEYLSLIPTRRADRRPLLWAYMTIPLQYYWVYEEWYAAFVIFIPVYAFLLIPTRMLLVGQTEGYIRSSGTIHWGLMTTVFSLSHASFLLILRSKSNPDVPSGPGMMLYLVMLTQLNDVFQCLAGKTAGKRMVVPSVSPGKTWEGLIGGVILTTALGIFLGPILTPMNHVQSVVAGLLISIGGFFGDINISAVKRDLGIKDTGNLLPGHGGILDRVDSLTYTAPLFFHYMYSLLSN